MPNEDSVLSVILAERAARAAGSTPPAAPPPPPPAAPETIAEFVAAGSLEFRTAAAAKRDESHRAIREVVWGEREKKP